MISFEPDWRLIIGLVVTILLGCGVGSLIRYVGELMPLPAPSAETEQQWKKLASQMANGSWIGFTERIIFFAACWLNGWLLISSWLVFKLGFYWQGANFLALPEKSPEPKELDYFIAKRFLGANYVSTVLVGTGVNVLIALVGVAVGKWVKLQ